jgi:hypothetical protein
MRPGLEVLNCKDCNRPALISRIDFRRLDAGLPMIQCRDTTNRYVANRKQVKTVSDKSTGQRTLDL